MNELVSRNTKYSMAVQEAILSVGHLTNAELIKILKSRFPGVSATTIHRSTARLQERGVITFAPTDKDGSMRYDANTTPHDHFICTNCGGLRDIDIADDVIPLVSKALGGCKITGRLVINGSCESCLNGGRDI
jgi:Fur family transcriptional regulator, peroxide stress response regulator